METMFVWSVIAMFIFGMVGLFLGGTVHKSEAGFWLGFFLGPIGWIIVFLLPRSNEITASGGSNFPEIHPAATVAGEHSSIRKLPDEPSGLRDLSSGAYKIWLVNHYSIEKNDALNKIICNDKLFETIEEALLYADSEEQLKLERAAKEKELEEIAAQERKAAREAAEAKHEAEKERFNKAWGPSIWFFGLLGLLWFIVQIVNAS